MSTVEHALTFKDAPEGFVHCWRCQQMLTREEWLRNTPCAGPPELVEVVTCGCLRAIWVSCAACGGLACHRCDFCHGCQAVICGRCLPEHRHSSKVP